MARSRDDMQLTLLTSKQRARWLLPIGVLLICATALALALLTHRWSAVAIRQESAQQKAIQTALAETANTKTPACAPEFSYAQSLPASISLDKLVQSLQDSSKAFGVAVISVSGEPHPATSRTLASLDVNIALHGAYPAIKSVLAESLSRFQTGAIQRMHFKREGTTLPTTEEVNVQVVFALRPQAVGTVDCRIPTVDGGAWESK
jgi:hypothetical protein